MNGDREDTAAVSLSAARANNRRDSVNIQISVECPTEPRISEIGYDGKETHHLPVSKGEKLYRNACKIDFGKENKMNGLHDDLVSVGIEDAREKENRLRRGRPDPISIVYGLETVRTKLRAAFTEMTVLHDVLSLASKDRRYLRLEPASNEPVEFRPHFSLYSKKKAAAGAALILNSAVDRLKQVMSSATPNNKVEDDYNSTLVKLREHWRLKKAGSVVSGDLSYRAVGSSLKGAGQFEIRKTEEPDQKDAVDVLIAGDLGGESCIQVDVESNAFPELAKRESDPKRHNAWSNFLTLDNRIHRQLTAAQNSLYCRELIMLLSAEAVNLPNQSSLSPVVFGDEIHYTSLLGHSVHVKLIQASDKKGTGSSPDLISSPPVIDLNPYSTQAESRTVELAMCRLLLTRMLDFNTPDIPMAACGPLGLKMFRRKMAIQARDRRVFKHGSRTLTSQLLDMTQGLLLKKRILKITSEFRSPDLIVVVHDCSSLASWKDSLIKISMTTPGFDLYNRTNCAFHICHGQVFFMTKDYLVPISVSDDLDFHLLYVEVVRQHAVVLQIALKTHRYEITQYEPTYQYFESAPSQTSSSISKSMSYGITVIARSPDERWWVKIVCSLRYVYRFYIANGRNIKMKTDAVRNDTFLPTSYHFHEVDLCRITAGETRMRRICLILGYLATLPENSTFLIDMDAMDNVTTMKRDGARWSKWMANEDI